MVKYILVCGGVISGIGKGVIGTSPVQTSSSDPNENPSIKSEPSSPKTLFTPRSAHQSQSTIHTPQTQSTPSSPFSPPCAIPPFETHPLSPPMLSLDTQTDVPPIPPPQPNSKNSANPVTPNTLHSMLSSINESDLSPIKLGTSEPLSSAWSFLNDPYYVHPLLAQPTALSDMSIASSTGLLLKTAGLKVTAIKIDPYMNIDAGTMAPTEHGEVYVLNDGGETDLDLGNYERYLNVSLGKDNNVTTGKVYQYVIERERRGDYLGKTVQIVPHLTNAIQDWIQRVSKLPVDETGEEPDVCIVELGGTVGDIESAPFIEAMRQFQFRVGHDNFALIYVSLIPVVGGEQKTKPTQAGVRDLRGLGLLPDLIACRCEHPLLTSTMDKVSMFCHVTPKQVLGVHNVSSTYHVPLLLKDQGLLNYLQTRLNLSNVKVTPELKKSGDNLMGRWRALTIGQERLFDTVSIVLVGKYTSLQDSYMSVVKALEHASLRCERKLILHWVDSEDLEPQAETNNPVRYHDAWRAVCSAKGIIVPGGFGHRGTEGMIAAVRWAREQSVPFLGICLGFQVAVIEWARNVCGLENAHSAELVPDCPHPVICFMPEISKTHMGGTMRLGLRPTVFESNTESSKLRKLYGSREVAWERHRHRYEVEPKYVEELESKGGLRFVGKDERGERMQMLELDDHPYFVGLQAHPEFCSRPLNPSPAFLGLVAAACSLELLEEQIENNSKSYVAPHPESAMVVPPSEAVTEKARGKNQAVPGVKVRSQHGSDDGIADVEVVGERLKKMGLENGREKKGEKASINGSA